MTRALDPRALAAARQRLREAAKPLGMVLGPAPSGNPAHAVWHCPGCRCWAAHSECLVVKMAEAPTPCILKEPRDMSPAELAACEAIRKSIGRAVA